MENDNKAPEMEQDENKNLEDSPETVDNSKQSDSNSNEDDKDWKAEALKWKAIADRNKDKKPENRSSKKSDDFDYGEKSFLAVNGIKTSEERDFTKNFIKETGKTLDDVLESRFFQEELKDFREKRDTANATPQGNKRATQSSRDSVDYWLAKPIGELPEDTELRRKVVKARRTKDAGMFSND